MGDLETLKAQLEKDAAALKNRFHAELQDAGLYGGEAATLYADFCRRVDAQVTQTLRAAEAVEAIYRDAQQTMRQLATATDERQAKELLDGFAARAASQ